MNFFIIVTILLPVSIAYVQHIFKYKNENNIEKKIDYTDKTVYDNQIIESTYHNDFIEYGNKKYIGENDFEEYIDENECDEYIDEKECEDIDENDCYENDFDENYCDEYIDENEYNEYEDEYVDENEYEYIDENEYEINTNYCKHNDYIISKRLYKYDEIDIVCAKIGKNPVKVTQINFNDIGYSLVMCNGINTQAWVNNYYENTCDDKCSVYKAENYECGSIITSNMCEEKHVVICI